MGDSPSRSVVTRIGLLAWTVVGVVVVLAMVVTAFAAVSELMLPLVFAVMLGVVGYPVARWLRGRGLSPALSALAVVLGFVAVGFGVVLLVVGALLDQAGELSSNIDRALGELAPTTDGVNLDENALADLRGAITEAAWFIGRGLLTLMVSGLSAVFGFVVGAILATLIMYYVLKDGPQLRAAAVQAFPAQYRHDAEAFFADAVLAVRRYYAGRTVMSAVIATVIGMVCLVLGIPMVVTIMVVNFVGGYIPYIGAFLGGSLAVLLALADGSLGKAIIVLVVVLASNLLLENLLEPRIMSDRLRIHPLVVLLATTAGGVLGGIVGLLLAVPLTVVVLAAIRRLRESGALTEARVRAEPVLRRAAEVVDGASDPGPEGR